LTKIKAVKGALREFMASESSALHECSDGLIGMDFSWRYEGIVTSEINDGSSLS
jgi:hypothetical protein